MRLRGSLVLVIHLHEYSSNHIHAVPGDVTAELAACCEALGVDAIDIAN